MKNILLIYLFVNMLFNSSCKSHSIKKLEISKDDYISFPDTSDVTQKVFTYYYNLGFAKNQSKQLSLFNNTQRTLCYFFICDGLIGNGGFISILQETNGEFNKGFLRALQIVGDIEGYNIFLKINSIYQRFNNYFDKQDIPPQLEEESDRYDKNLDDELSRLEEQWYSTSSERELKFNNYFNKNKDELIKIK